MSLRLTAALWVFCSTALAQSHDAGTPVPLAEVRARGIKGELGVPLGTIVTIEGRVVDGDSLRMKALSGLLLLKIERVNGAALPAPVTLRFSGEQKLVPKPGQSFSLIAYETGGFTGAPDGLVEHVEPFATTGYAFQSRVEVLKAVPKPKK